MLISKDLYIVPSKQIARNLKEYLLKENPFIVVKSLDNVINDIYTSISNKEFLDDNIATNLIYKIIKEENIEYFLYLKNGSESLNYIYDFIIKCKRNSIDFSTIIKNEEKLKAIEKINLFYEKFKINNNLYDVADMEEFVYNLFNNYDKEAKENHIEALLKKYNLDYFDDFNKIYITDNFTIGKTNLFTSKYQEMIVNLLKTIFNTYEYLNEIKGTPKLIKPKQEIFDNIYEVKTTFKIIRKLMESGVNDDEILVVTTDIEEYAPLFRLFLDEYELKGYDSIGVALAKYKGPYFNGGDLIKKSYQDYLAKFKAIKDKSKKLNIAIDEESLKLKLLKTTFVLSEKIGIELTEPNQLLFSTKIYEHIIFIGTDIEHFPPKSEDNFLYTINDSIKYFYTNNYYDSSEFQFQELKRLSKNLYILNANYKDKKKLSPSVLIPEKFDYEFDIDNIKSKNDLIFNKQVATLDEPTKEYVKSINNIFFTEFDGIGVENIKIKHLSASQLNKYSTCPLTYLYEYNIKIKAPKEVNSGFDKLEIGTLMHSIFEKFGKAVKDGKTPNYNLMKTVVEELEEEKTKELGTINVFHKLIFEDFKKGFEENEEKGVLAKFVDYYNENKEEFENFENTEFEKKFYLNKELSITNVKNENEEEFFIKGFIDRVDNLNNYVNVIDYKSKSKLSLTKEMKKVKEFKEFQLSLYTLYAKQFYKKKIVSSFLTFKVDDKDYVEFAKITTDSEKAFKIVNKGKKNERKKEIAIYFDDEFEKNLKNKIFEIKESIEKGQFYFNNEDDDVCKYCNIRNLCHQKLLTKEL